MDWYLKVLKNYVGFRGRARRKEYWMFILVNIINDPDGMQFVEGDLTTLSNSRIYDRNGNLIPSWDRRFVKMSRMIRFHRT